MESTGQWKKYTVLFFYYLVFNTTSCYQPSSGNPVNVSGGRQSADTVPGQHMPPSWYYTSIDAVPKHGTSSLRPHSRWQTQMAFSKSVYSFEVKEDTAPGTVVGKVETGSESLTPITYSVLEDDGENLFLLSPLSGEFLLSRSLDFEVQRFYILSVALQQWDSQWVSSVRVYFNVLDVNDNPPLFSQETFSASLLEDTQAGTCFMFLNVSDKDDGVNRDFTVRVVSGDEEGVFFINSVGSLCLKTELDREKQSSYNLTVMASDCAQPVSLQLTSTAHVTVDVYDINDNAPVFVSAKMFTIPEDAALHSVVMTVQAEDEDTGSNGEVLYYLNNNSGGLFSIDERRGHIYLEEELDREKVDTLMITVTASDRGSSRMKTTINLTAHIEDVNDNDPEFSQSSYSLTVREDIRRGTSLLQVHARDEDIRENGQVRYRLTQASPFVVDSVRGVVSVMEELDRETSSNYDFIITAVDGGSLPRSATAAISVTVLDVNDFTPTFTPETLTIHVMENEDDPYQLIHQVSALDDDLGVNSQLTYFIQNRNNNGLFSVSPSGTFQILQSLDREKEPSYQVTIIAVDSGLPALTGTLTVHIMVDDINDNRPEFNEEIYNTIVSEDSPTGTVFAMITASDIDEGINGEIRYSLENLDVPFTIDETSGELFTANILDRETLAIYRLIVIGSDKHPTEPLSSSVLVTVLIGDVNDHWPQFMNSPYVAYVPTEMAPGSVVCAVRATDGDTDMNAELHYLLYGPSSDLFSIHPYSGTVFTSSSLQRTEDITINVHVEDAGENPKFDITTISIRFQNISEFPEMKVDVLSYSLSEDEPVGTLVAVVSAASSRAEPVSFYLASGNFDGMFHVEQLSGALTVESPLDYESKKEFILLIEARDSGLAPFSSFEEIHINISDVNDNAPHFTQAEYRCEVFENSPPSFVCDVLAIDADSGSYGTVQYNITKGNTDSFFTIDPETGLLSTTESLDREINPEFRLIVEASELYNPFNRDNATVIVVVLDRNDNAPRFSQIFLTVVPEDSPMGHTIIHVTATDDDAGPNAVINYSIISQNEDIPFDIDFINGFITVRRPLDREVQDHYILRVNANDSAWSISTDVTVVVADVNDNAPVFANHFNTAVLPETKDEVVFVMQVIAADADLGLNGEIMYVIEPPNEEFWVNATTGEIYTKQPLMLKDSASEIYQFIVFAFDCGSSPLHSHVTITVRLEPYNHHPPVFIPPKPLIAIPYHLSVGAEVAQFTAIDQDANNSTNGVEYFLKRGNASSFFWIHPDDGKLILNQSLAGSMNAFLTLVVLAKDHGSPSLSSQVEILFEITGRNQFPPSFGEPDVTFSIPEDLSVGSVIGKIQADDKDYGSNGAIMYCITPENQYLPFSVGETSGLLTLIRELDFEAESIYHLQIKAVDGGWASKTGVLNVTVVVMDVNDNPPVFSSLEYIISVPENSNIGRNVLNVKAEDADSGVNAHIVYSFTAGHVDKFAIDSRNGTITTLVIFDYEQEQNFGVTIKASNTGSRALFSLAHVVIQISDVNEFKPRFNKKEFHFSVFKNAPVGTVIGKVAATDDDQGPEGQVFYLMFGQNIYTGFDVNDLSGEIFTTRSLRKQGNSNVDLKVLAKNPGVITGMDEDEVSVHVTVIDTNEAPMFTSVLYKANMSEDSLVGTLVTTVSALDDDSFMDWNRFVFSIENGNTNFSFAVNPSSGVISVNSPLDRELWPFYNLTLIATDNGSPPATGTTNVLITIEDVNDNAPKLTFTEAHVEENQPQGTIVARLNASDSDSLPNQGPFTFWLVNPLTDDAFSLTADGLLITTRALDHEEISSYQILVTVHDAGIPQLSSTAMLSITIINENDNPPMPRNIVIEVKYFGSSFQGGMIGNVHPEDPDELNTFNCAIKSGSHNMFTISNGTCELWSSPFQGEATFNLTVEATDQLHFPVNNSIYVNYKGFTNASIDSCILFYVSTSSIEDFVSSNYLRFVKALDSLFNLQASKTHVFGIKQIGSEILLLAAVKNYNGRYLSKEVASGISAGHKRLLEVQSNVTISHITSDPCLTSPCQNGATCKKHIYISQDVAVLESEGVIFVSPQKEVFNCSCPRGFTGTLCEDDIDECEMNPCKNKGTCMNTIGSFYCLCPSGFSGSVCSADGDECLEVECQNGGTCTPTQDGYQCQCVPGFEGTTCEEIIDYCRSNPCAQGNCTSSQTGFTCHCPFGVTGAHCEEQSYGFEELSFMEFPPLDRRINLITLDFATVQRDSLLLYNPGGSTSREFFALEIVDGTVQLSYDLDSGPVRLQTNKQVTDGYFHSVTARRIGNIGSLHVDNCSDVDHNGFCFSHSDSSNSDRTLDVSSNMTFGGLRTVESILMNPAQIKTHDFVGCLRNIRVNGILLTPSMALSTYKILDRCPRSTPSPCQTSPCKNGGVCHDLWFDYHCECKSPFTGSNCTKEISEELVLRFSGMDFIQYMFKERFKRDFLLKSLLNDEKEGDTRNQNMLSIKFRTQDDGVLMFIVHQTGQTMLMIKDRKLVCFSKDTLSGRLLEFTVDSPVADGVWHVLSLFSKGQNIFLHLDGLPVLNVTDQKTVITPVTVEKIVLGAAVTEETTFHPSGFIGCVQSFNVSGHSLPVSGRSMIADVWPSPSLLQSSCSSPGVCLMSSCSGDESARGGCHSADCQHRWRCRAAVPNISCICFHNVSDHTCDVCVSTRDSRDRCSEAQGSRHLWLIAVVLPLISILVIIGMLAFLFKARRKTAKGENVSTQQKTEQGTDNMAFCFDDNSNLTGAASTGQEKKHNPLSADQQNLREVFSSEASLSSIQPQPCSEPEYYEIGSISSVSHSESASLALSFHKHSNLAKSVKAEPKRWGDLRMLLTGFKNERCREERTNSAMKHPNMASINKQMLMKMNTENFQDFSTCNIKNFPQPEFIAPVQCLTFDEISKLNNPLEERPPCEASLTSSTLMEATSESDADSSFTGAELDCGQFSVISNRKFSRDQPSVTVCSCRKQDIFTLNVTSKLDSPSADNTERSSCSMLEQWDNILNMHLPFSSYAPVFEDIACLPPELSHGYDMQGDTEEII